MIETIAAYCAVIEFLAKVVKYGSHIVQDTLSNTAVTIEKDTNIDTIEDARHLVEKALTKQMGAQASTSIIDDIVVMEQVLANTALQYRPDYKNKHIILPHSQILSAILDDIAKTLDEWQCFVLWGEKYKCRYYSGSRMYYDHNSYHLPFPRTMKGVRESGILSGIVKPWILLRINTFLWRCEEKRSDELWSGYDPSYTLTIHKKEVDDSDFLRLLGISFVGITEYRIDEGPSPSPGLDYLRQGWETRKNNFAISYAEFQPILLGILLDFLYYAHAIRQQAERGQSLFEKLFRRKNS